MTRPPHALTAPAPCCPDCPVDDLLTSARPVVRCGTCGRVWHCIPAPPLAWLLPVVLAAGSVLALLGAVWLVAQGWQAVRALVGG